MTQRPHLHFLGSFWSQKTSKHFSRFCLLYMYQVEREDLNNNKGIKVSKLCLSCLRFLKKVLCPKIKWFKILNLYSNTNHHHQRVLRLPIQYLFILGSLMIMILDVRESTWLGNLVKSLLIHFCYLIIKLRECYIGHQGNWPELLCGQRMVAPIHKHHGQIKTIMCQEIIFSADRSHSWWIFA